MCREPDGGQSEGGAGRAGHRDAVGGGSRSRPESGVPRGEAGAALAESSDRNESEWAGAPPVASATW